MIALAINSFIGHTIIQDVRIVPKHNTFGHPTLVRSRQPFSFTKHENRPWVCAVAALK
jgi:hypothetical protein